MNSNQAKLGCFLIIVNGNQGTSMLIISESKASSLHSKTAWLPKFISSKYRGCPYLKATRQANSDEKVLEVPDGPSNRTGIPLDI